MNARRWTGFAALALWLMPPAVHANPASFAALAGVVRDSVNSSPLAGAAVTVVEPGRSALTGEDGAFRFPDLPPVEITLRVSRVGYLPHERRLSLASGESPTIAILLTRDVRMLEPVTVEGHEHKDEMARTPIALSGEELDAERGRTLADTIDDAPGLAQRSMGPAPARPVMRGLGGERLLILEDGAPTGDLSATAPDHAVVIDPMTSREVRVLRGPAAVRYGSSVLAGVIDVERGYVPRRMPGRIQGSTAIQGESVNNGGTAAAEILAPAGPVAIRLDGSTRRSGDISTPGGTLANSAIRSWTASAGASWIRPRQLVGAAANLYESDYGIPGGFLGGHTNGVDIEADRRHLDLDYEHDFHSSSPGHRLDRFAAKGTYSRYFHRELESSGVCGISFGLLTLNGMGVLQFSGLGPGGRGYTGASIEHRNYATGCLSFIPETDELTLAGFAYNSMTRGPWSLGLSLRVDNREVTPAAPDSNKAGLIRQRGFTGFSGGLDIERRITESLGATFTVMRSFHPPGIEELFSDGPHLAAYSYEVGNADLGEETGTGLELALRKDDDQRSFQLSVFRNAISSFIYATNTGELEYGPGEEGFLARYQYVGRDAVLYGGELSAEWQLIPAFRLGSVLSYVRGELRDRDGGSLPSIPPLSGNAYGRYKSGPWSGEARLRAAAPQDRVGEFEDPTAGYVVFDTLVQYRILARGTVQSMMLSVENLADTEYRNHLSRIRSIMPEPGRNIRLFYRMTFGPGSR